MVACLALRATEVKSSVPVVVAVSWVLLKRDGHDISYCRHSSQTNVVSSSCAPTRSPAPICRGYNGQHIKQETPSRSDRRIALGNMVAARAVDPTYPLYPVACFLSSAMLLSVLLTSFIRQSWNLGVTFLCGWLLLYNLINAVDYIVWSDNDNIKLYFWCDVSACFYVELYNRALVTCFPSPSLPPTNRCLDWC